MVRNARRFLSVLLGAACLVTLYPAVAQDYPSKPLRLVVANAPGTDPDVIARIVGPEMSKLLGQPVVIENKPGAGQLIGYEYVAKQVPEDGYTIGIVNVTALATLPLTVKDLRFDPLADLPPLIGLVEGRLAAASSSKHPWKTFKELVAHARANPGKMNYGSPSPIVRLATEALLRDLALNVTYVPYSSGAAFLQALVAGDIHMAITSEQSLITFGEKLKVLAMTGDQRSASLRDVPTFAELGHPQIRGIGYSLNSPRRTPKVATDKVYEAASRTLQLPEVLRHFEKLRYEVVAQSPEVAAKGLAEQARLYSDLAKSIGIQRQ